MVFIGKMLIIFALGLLAACNSEQAKLSPISKISADFSTGTTTSFSGGLIVVGVRQDANEKISFAFPNGNPTPIIMERGDWNFYSLGYSSVSGDLRSGNFGKLTECGFTSVKIRGGERKSINLNITSDGCSGKLSRDLKLQKIVVDSCPSFSYYNNAAPYMFYPRTVPDAATCSNQPQDQSSNILYYKIFAVNSDKGVVSESFSSPCLDEIALGTYPRMIPVAIAPLKVKIYRSLASCNGDKVAHNTFYYPNGITASEADGAESTIQDNYLAGSVGRLFLPEAHTKKYQSPFLNNIPRFFCDSPDCFLNVAQPGPDSRTIQVKWGKPTKDQLIISDINGNYTCDDLTHYSTFFGLSDCKIRNNSLYATVSRNVITCQATAGPRSFADLNERNGLIQVLYSTGGHSYIAIQTSEGVAVNSIDLGADINFTHVTATDAGDIYVANPSLDIVRPYKRMGYKSWTVQPDISLTDAGMIEVTPDGKYLVYSGNPDYRINIFNLTTNTASYMMPADLPMFVRKLQYVEGKLYAHIVDDNVNDPSMVYRYDISNGTLQFEGDIMVGGGGKINAFHINKHLYNYMLSNYTVGTATGYDTATYYLDVHTVNGPSQPFASAVDDIIVVNNTAYGILKGSSTILSLQWKDGLFVTPAAVADQCEDDFIVKLGGVVAANHRVVTKVTPDNQENSMQIWDAAHKLVGKKSADPNKSYFRSLSEEETRSTTGGTLSLVQRLLGPHGVGGLLSEYGTCDDVKNIVQNVGPINKQVSVTDPYRGYQGFTVKVESNADIIPAFTCHDGLINAGGCTNTYEIKMTVTSNGLLERESYVMKLHCTSMVGQLDYRNTSSSSVWKQQLYWNTTLPLTSRVDNYKLITSDDHDVFESSQVFSTGSYIRARSVRKDFWSDYNYADITDYQIDTIGLKHYVRKIHLGATDANTHTDYGTYRTETAYTGIADYCLPLTQTNPLANTTAGCVFSNIVPTRVKASTLSWTAIENQFTFESLFNTFP